MKNKINLKVILTILLILIVGLILQMLVTVKGVFFEGTENDSLKNYEIDITSDRNSLLKGETANIDLYITGNNYVYFTGSLKYDTEKYEAITADNVELNSELTGWLAEDDVLDSTAINISSQDFEKTCDGYLATITLTAKENIDKVEFSIEKIYLSDIEGNDNSNGYENTKIELKETLYLISQKYAIGEDNIDVYRKGDKYINKISPETTVAEFKANCETNGEIEVHRTDGSLVGDNEYIGTKMIVKVQKDDEIIEISAIVMGDFNQDGEIGISDVTTANLYNLEDPTIVLTEIELKAGDIDDDGQVSISEVVSINRASLGLEKLTYTKVINNPEESNPQVPEIETE